jgi:UrcA family protein
MKTASLATNLIACAAIVGAVATGFATGPAFAQTAADNDAFQFKFSYKASELQSEPAAQKLLARLEGAVRDHCNNKVRMTMDEHARTLDCVSDTMRQTISKFASGTVAQAYDLRAGG